MTTLADIERLSDGHLRSTPLDVLRSMNTHAEFRGAATKGPHTATDASLAQYLEDHLAAKNIHLDLSVTIER